MNARGDFKCVRQTACWRGSQVEYFTESKGRKKTILPWEFQEGNVNRGSIILLLLSGPTDGLCQVVTRTLKCFGRYTLQEQQWKKRSPPAKSHWGMPGEAYVLYPTAEIRLCPQPKPAGVFSVTVGLSNSRQMLYLLKWCQLIGVNQFCPSSPVYSETRRFFFLICLSVLHDKITTLGREYKSSSWGWGSAQPGSPC